MQIISLKDYNDKKAVPTMMLSTGEEVRIDPLDVVLVYKQDYEALLERCEALEDKSNELGLV